MIPGLAALVFIPLLSMTFAHVMWAFGSTWPMPDKASLARTVIGRKDMEHMPPRLLTLCVGIFIFCSGIFALAMTDPAPSMTVDVIGAALALIFVARGSLGYTNWWRQRTPEQPFASLDKKVYSPVSLAIGAGYLILLIWRLA